MPVFLLLFFQKLQRATKCDRNKQTNKNGPLNVFFPFIFLTVLLSFCLSLLTTSNTSSYLHVIRNTKVEHGLAV